MSKDETYNGWKNRETAWNHRKYDESDDDDA